jgi:hypothetical protein
MLPFSSQIRTVSLSLCHVNKLVSNATRRQKTQRPLGLFWEFKTRMMLMEEYPRIIYLFIQFLYITWCITKAFELNSVYGSILCTGAVSFRLARSYLSLWGYLYRAKATKIWSWTHFLINTMIILDMPPCSLVEIYLFFESTCFLHLLDSKCKIQCHSYLYDRYVEVVAPLLLTSCMLRL